MAVTEESFKLEELRCESSLSGKSRNTNDSSDQSPPKATIEAASSPNVPNTGSEPARTSSLKQLETTPSRASTSQSDSNSKRDGDQSPAMNPLRMNSFVRATQSPIELAATPLQPYPTKRQPSTNPYIPSPVTPFSALSQVSPVFAPSVNNTYNERLHVQPSPKPGYASSIASSTSTVFSPDVYTTPPPYLQTSRPSSTSNYRPQYPVVPLPTYNPAAYVSQTHQQRINLPNYSQKQPPPQKQQRFQERQRLPTDQYQNAHSELPLRYTPYPYAASSPHRPPKSHVSTPKEVQATHRSTSSQSSVSKMATNIVPTISLPIPAPKRTTMDMRSLVGMGLNTHVKPEQDLEANRLPEKGSKGEAGIPSSPKRFSFELPPGLDRTDSLIRRSSSPFRERARNSSLKRMTTRPQQNEENQQLIQKTKTETKRREREERYTVKRSSSLVRSVSRSSFRGRSTSRPRRDGMGAESPDRDRKRSESRRRLMAENNSKAGFSFGFKGQDSV